MRREKARKIIRCKISLHFDRWAKSLKEFNHKLFKVLKWRNFDCLASSYLGDFSFKLQWVDIEICTGNHFFFMANEGEGGGDWYFVSCLSKDAVEEAMLCSSLSMQFPHFLEAAKLRFFTIESTYRRFFIHRASSFRRYVSEKVIQTASFHMLFEMKKHHHIQP